MTEQEKTELIASCMNFDQLYLVLKECEPIISYSRENPIEYSAEKIINRINRLRFKNGVLENITRANGLRYKVRELLIKEFNQKL